MNSQNVGYIVIDQCFMNIVYGDYIKAILFLTSGSETLTYPPANLQNGM